MKYIIKLFKPLTVGKLFLHFIASIFYGIILWWELTHKSYALFEQAEGFQHIVVQLLEGVATFVIGAFIFIYIIEKLGKHWNKVLIK